MIRAGSLGLTVLLTIASANLGIAQNSLPGAAGQRSTAEPASAPRFADPASLLDQLPSVAQSSFIQNVLLILLTAAVIGLAGPRIKAGMDLRYFREQERHKNELSRQSKLIEQKIGLLNKYRDSLWQFHYMFASLPTILSLVLTKVSLISCKESMISPCGSRCWTSGERYPEPFIWFQKPTTGT